jgi:hypothetical protein
VNGLWVPTKVIQDRSLGTKLGISRFSYDVSRFERGTVADAQLTVDFPIGTQVVDHINKFAFQVLPGGGQKFLPLFNPETGLTTIGKETPQEIFSAARDPFPPPRSRRAGWVAAGAGVLLLISAVTWIARRRKATAA